MGKESIKPVSDKELPPEFKRFDKPFGLEQHVLNFIVAGLIPHVFTFYYLFNLSLFGGHIPFKSIILAIIYGYVAGLGTTVGSHRYWTHRTFKAKLPLKILLMLMQTAALQYPIFKWCRDHRVHHKYTDTDADPHNSKRGFWFSHITWLFQPKHPEVEEKLKIVDISDLTKDPVVRFQSKYYWELVILVFLAVPMTICHLLVPEMSFIDVFSCNMARYFFSAHFTFLVNSVAHMWGDKPYDKDISSTENKFVSLLAAGEGWHNYHHTFPWDYKSAELGFRYNFSTAFIHFFAMIGWAYDLKTVSRKLLVDRINRTGDGSHPLYTKSESESHNEKLAKTTSSTCWGWGDEQVRKEDVEITETLFLSNSRRG